MKLAGWTHHTKMDIDFVLGREQTIGRDLRDSKIPMTGRKGCTVGEWARYWAIRYSLRYFSQDRCFTLSERENRFVF